MADMESEWLTYQQAAERLGCSPEAIRQKAIRGRWQKTIGNDKRPLIRLPDGWINAVRTAVERKNNKNERSVRTVVELASDTQLIKALEAHVETLKEQLAAAEARDAQHVAQLAAEQAKTEKAIEAFSMLAQRLEAMAAQHAIKPWWRRLLRRAG
jgi:hypothetical protein